MTLRSHAVLVVLAAALLGCADRGVAPAGPPDETPQVLFLVKNEVFGIRLDGTMRRSFGVVGDDRLRAGYPRMLPDGRLSVVADQVGEMFPYTSSGDRGYDRVGIRGVSLGDGACGVLVGGEAKLIYFATTIYDDGTLTSTAMRATTDGLTVEGFGLLEGAGLFGPSPDGDDHVLAVHSPLAGDDQIWRLDVSGDQQAIDHPEVLATIPFPQVAASPSRLPDGRVIFVSKDMRDPDQIGELWLVERDGSMHGSGIRGVDDAVVATDGRVVLQAGGGDQMGDLLVTDLVAPPYNLTNTPFIAEHLGWADPDTAGQM
jgi:hypothetical protein